MLRVNSASIKYRKSKHLINPLNKNHDSLLSWNEPPPFFGACQGENPRRLNVKILHNI